MRYITFALLLALSGCTSIIPYENTFACKLPDSLGKCQEMGDSYKEAVTGVSVQAPMKPASEQSDSPGIEHKANEPHLGASSSDTEYTGYINEYYGNLRTLISQPKPPVITQPTQVRMLVLPYANKNNSVMYMHRHVYWVHKSGEFVLGNYLKAPQAPLEAPMKLTK